MTRTPARPVPLALAATLALLLPSGAALAQAFPPGGFPTPDSIDPEEGPPIHIPGEPPPGPGGGDDLPPPGGAAPPSDEPGSPDVPPDDPPPGGGGDEPPPGPATCGFLKADRQRFLASDLFFEAIEVEDGQLVVDARANAYQGVPAEAARLLMRVCVLRQGGGILGSQEAAVGSVVGIPRTFAHTFRFDRAPDPGEEIRVVLRVMAQGASGTFDSGDPSAHTLVVGSVPPGNAPPPDPDDPPLDCDPQSDQEDYAVVLSRVRTPRPDLFRLVFRVRNQGRHTGPEAPAWVGYADPAPPEGDVPEPRFLGRSTVGPLACGEAQTLRAELDLRGVAMETDALFTAFSVQLEDANRVNDHARLSFSRANPDATEPKLRITSIRARVESERQDPGFLDDPQDPEHPGPDDDFVPPGDRAQFFHRLIVEAEGLSEGAPPHRIAYFNSVLEPVRARDDGKEWSDWTRTFSVRSEVSLGDRVRCGQTVEGRLSVFPEVDFQILDGPPADVAKYSAQVRCFSPGSGP